MMGTFLRLTWRLQRWEIAVLIGGSLLFAGITALAAWQTSLTGADLQACYSTTSGGPPSSACQALIERGNFLSKVDPILEGATTVVPFIVGILLGAPLVAREIEKRTSSIAWSLSLSRTRWLALRALPILIAVGVALLLVGQASEALITATPSGTLGFPVFAMHGPVVAARGVAVFCIGVLVGLLMGRTLPAILMTGVAAIALVLALTLGRGALMRAEAVWIPSDSADFSGVLVYDTAYRDDATGKMLSYDEALRSFPEAFGPTGSGIPPGMSQLYLTAPPDLYSLYVLREIGALGAVTVLALAGSVWVLRFRRPDLG